MTLGNLFVMAETTVENRVCQNCGADVRPNSLFCYYCGGSLAPKAVVEAKNGDQPAKRTNALIIKNTTDQPILKRVLPAEEPKLKSAAAMRRKSRRVQPKRIEIIWEEHENAPNGWFVFAAIFLTLFAAGILFLAIYLK
jgi:hypothetical protein